jgi:hypothetical protein
MLTDEEEKELKLRDQFAMAAMKGILAGAADSLDFGDEGDKEEFKKGLEKLTSRLRQQECPSWLP